MFCVIEGKRKDFLLSPSFSEKTAKVLISLNHTQRMDLSYGSLNIPKMTLPFLGLWTGSDRQMWNLAWERFKLTSYKEVIKCFKWNFYSVHFFKSRRLFSCFLFFYCGKIFLGISAAIYVPGKLSLWISKL